MITIQRPYIFAVLLILIPFVIFNSINFKKLPVFLSGFSFQGGTGKKQSYTKILKTVWIRTVLRICACIFVVAAASGIYWGTKIVPVQKSGHAVSMVFDISYSMTARDASARLTRLEAARRYALGLIERMEGVSVSVVIAKGDGVIAVPLTDDRKAVETMIENLSPLLMTSAGSSIGKGILAAIKSFPVNSPQASHIWVFTDGDETDNSMASALDDAARFGFPVTLIGFGNPRPIEITAGDGKTKVKTFLNAEKMIDYAAAANKKVVLPVRGKSGHTDFINYVTSYSESSAFVLLNQLKGGAASYSYEVQPVSRHLLFIFLAILFYMFSYIVSELNLENFHLLNHKNAAVFCLFMVFAPVFFTSCDFDKTSVLKGNWAWYEGNYQNATGSYLRVFIHAQAQQNQQNEDYACFNLASTYIRQEEYDSAIHRLEQISPEADKTLLSAVNYNLGVIANIRGESDKARDFFKRAILLDEKNLNAKINLEFTQQNLESRQSTGAETEMTGARFEKKETELEKEIFNIIIQEEKEQWKNIQSSKKENSSIDY